MYCSNCGKLTTLKHVHNEGDIPFCESCNKLFFPTINVAIIAILTNQLGEVCLVDQSSNSSYKVLIAGFIKPEETLEDCVTREILEELGVRVSSCQYLNSYFYGNNNVLMVGYHATTNEVNFTIDKTEIDHAQWFKVDDVIGRMREGSIADQLYRQFYSEIKQNKDGA